MNEGTSHDIMNAVGNKNVATLVRWHRQHELIPPPEIKTHPSGRGKIGYWPRWVFDRCVRIKQLQNEGKSRAEISQILGSDWKDAAKKQKNHYDFATVSRKMDMAAALLNLQERVESLLRDWSLARLELIRDTRVQTLAEVVITKSIELMSSGFNAFLIITEKDVSVSADFVVSQKLSSMRSISEAFMVVPIWKEVKAYTEKVASLPNNSTSGPFLGSSLETILAMKNKTFSCSDHGTSKRESCSDLVREIRPH